MRVLCKTEKTKSLELPRSILTGWQFFFNVGLQNLCKKLYGVNVYLEIELKTTKLQPNCQCPTTMLCSPFNSFDNASHWH